MGDGCGWGASTANVSGVGALKSLSNLVTGAVSVPVGALTTAVTYPFMDANSAYNLGKGIAKAPLIDNNEYEPCYKNCDWNELETIDGKGCYGYQNGKFYQRERYERNRKNLGARKRRSSLRKRHSVKRHSSKRH